MFRTKIVTAFGALALGAAFAAAAAAPTELLNVSYDVSRELFAQINPAFVAEWQKRTGQTIEVKQSHGGSSAQARAVSEGLAADVVTFNQVTDIEFLRKSGLVSADWATRLPHGSVPYYSLPVFLVRAENPKRILDWNDLAKPGVKVVFPNPKTSGNGRYTYLSAYAYELDRTRGDQDAAAALVGKVVRNVAVFDAGGRGSTTTFVQRGIGDVLVSFEAEVNSIRREFGSEGFEVVVPSVSLRADFPVAVVDKVVAKNGSGELATAYLQFLYGATGQDILAKNFNRVNDPQVAARYSAQFPKVRLLTVEAVFGSWDQATKQHFAEGGLFDKALAAGH